MENGTKNLVFFLRNCYTIDTAPLYRYNDYEK